MASTNTRTLSILLACLVGGAAHGAESSASLPVADSFESLDWKAELEQIMADPEWIGPPVERPFWALDGRHVLFELKEQGSPLRKLWRVARQAGAAEPLADADYAAVDAADPVFDAARRRAAFVRAGDVFVRELASGGLVQLTRTPEDEASPMFSADGAMLVWRRGNDWFRHDFASALTSPLPALVAGADPDAAEPSATTEHQLRLSSTLAREKQQREARKAREQALRAADRTRAPAKIFLGDGIEIDEVVVAPDARHALVVTHAKGAETGRAGKMPKYVTESGYEEVEDVRTRVGLKPPLPQSLRWVDLQTGDVHAIKLDGLAGIDIDPLADLRAKADLPALEGARPVRVDAVRWHRAGDRVAVMLRAVDNKDRWIVSLQPTGDADKAPSPRLLHRLQDPAWINWGFNDFGWLPDGATLWYLSEESGFSHLYLRDDADRAKARALTSGRWEASEVAWNADGSQAYFLCNRSWPGDYEVCRVGREGGEVVELTAVDAVEQFVLSPDGSALALRVSAHHTPPQLAVLEIASRAMAMRTDTRSEAYKARTVMAPEYVQVPSTHGAGTIWGKLYRPADMQPGKRYPIALFVHGAGYLQNVSARYPNYFREQRFNELLVQSGYIVLDLDYRASEGYGRDWRTAIYRQMGHPELEDYLDGIDWLVEQHQGDRSRVGIYGGSYGGFMAFMAMFRAPDAFHAGAALRPVTDWTTYNHEYTSNILNTPELDPEAYKRSSPIEYAENLRGGLLIAHGMIDDNVFYQDSVRLAQRLIELRKDNWELASYPLERHGYVHPESWYDQYRRIYELFERELSARTLAP